MSMWLHFLPCVAFHMPRLPLLPHLGCAAILGHLYRAWDTVDRKMSFSRQASVSDSSNRQQPCPVETQQLHHRHRGDSPRIVKWQSWLHQQEAPYKAMPGSDPCRLLQCGRCGIGRKSRGLGIQGPKTQTKSVPMEKSASRPGACDCPL